MTYLKKLIFKTISASLILSFFSFSLSANGAEFTSAYSKIDLNECILLDADDLGAKFACPGYKGYPLYVAEGDLRFFVSYGFGAINEKAARQTLPNFNTINDTLEWRLSNKSGRWLPIATILRWLPDISDQNGGEFKEGSILVVTKIESGNTCHIAYIDTQLVSGANEIARAFADNESENFNCETDDIFLVPS